MGSKSVVAETFARSEEFFDAVACVVVTKRKLVCGFFTAGAAEERTRSDATTERIVVQCIVGGNRLES
jgi:hypothetical protein